MVDMNPNAASGTEDDIWAFIQGGAVKTLTFTQTDQWGNKSPMPIGTFYEGDLKSPPTRRQQTDPDTNLPKTFPDGNPMWNIVLELSTQYRDRLPDGSIDPEDDGTRRIYLNRFGQQALQQEMSKKGLKKFGVGTHIKWILSGFKANGNGYQPSKLQTIELSNPTEALTPDQAATQAMIQAGPNGQPVATYPAGQVPQQQPVQQAPQGAMPPQAQQYQQPVPQQAAPQPQPAPQAPVQQPVAVPVQQAQPVAQAPAEPAGLDAATTARIQDGAGKLAAVGFSREQIVGALAAMPENAGISATQIDDAIPM